MATRKTNPVKSAVPNTYGPPLGNIEEPQSYLKIKQNIDGLTAALNAITPVPEMLSNTQLAQVQKALSAAGDYPLNLTNLVGKIASGVASLNALVGVLQLVSGSGISITLTGQNIHIGLTNEGPGAGTYTVGAKLTGGGNNGTITIDAQGRITAVTQAS